MPAVSLPEATPTQTTPTLVTPSVENLSDVPVAHSNITDLEKAMQEAGDQSGHPEQCNLGHLIFRTPHCSGHSLI